MKMKILLSLKRYRQTIIKSPHWAADAQDYEESTHLSGRLKLLDTNGVVRTGNKGNPRDSWNLES